MGGGRGLETTSNNLDPDFGWSSLKLSWFFCPNFSYLQNKKGFLVELTSGSSPILITNVISGGEVISVDRAKIGLKVAKNVVFCILSSPSLAALLINTIANCNCNYILITKLPWPGDSEMTFRSSSQAATCPSVYHTRWRLHTVPLIAERQAGSCEYQFL